MRKNLFLCVALTLLVGSLYCQDEEFETKTLILNYWSGGSYDLTLLRRINMGMHGGDNWLVEWTSNSTREARSSILFMYVINDGSIIRDVDIGPNFDVSEETDFDIMKDIPGTRIGEGSCVVYDYNNDGFDEIFNYGFWASMYLIRITGYDLEKKNITSYADIPFQIIDRERGPAPVEFVTYKGMKGFKVYYFVGEVGGGPGWVPNPDKRNGKWIFYAWDDGRRKFVEIEEFMEDWEKSYIEPSQPILAEQSTDEVKLVEDRGVQEEAASTPADSGKSTKSIFYIVIIAAIAVLAAAIVFIIVKRKKK
jgi:hypothetical protein